MKHITILGEPMDDARIVDDSMEELPTIIATEATEGLTIPVRRKAEMTVKASF